MPIHGLPATAAATETERSTGQHRRILDAVGHGVVELTADGRVSFANPAAAELLGYTPEELRGCAHPIFLASDAVDGGQHLAALGRVRAACGKHGRWSGSMPLRRKDGTSFRAQLVCTASTADGRDAGMVLVFSDVSETEEQLARMGMAVEQSSDMVIITDRDGVITHVNPSFETITGYRREEVIGRTPRILKSGAHDDGHYRALWRALDRGDSWSGVFVNRRKDGSHYTAEATITSLKNEIGDVTSFVAVQRDVTAQRALTEQLYQSQKMEAVGKLAGGVAHDMNNILATVMVAASIIADHEPAGDSRRPHLEVIANACRRGRDLISKLLGFSGKGAFVKTSVSLNAIVEDTVRLLERSLLRRVRLRAELAAGLPAISADRGQITQVLINLCLNAADAIDGKGTIVVSTCAVDDGAGGVRLQVRDDGKGMTEETRKRVFEPFFTTKAPEKGTGLGLSLAYGAMRSHGGTISIASQLDQGTTVTLDFPAHHEPAQPLTFPPPSNRTPGSARGGILLVDDEEALTKCLVELLEVEGFRVWWSNDGDDAIATFQAHKDEVDVVLVDLLMPGIGGAEVIARLRTIAPQVAVLVTSGFGGDALTNSARSLGAAAFLAKPFEPDHLLTELKSLVSRAGTS